MRIIYLLFISAFLYAQGISQNSFGTVGQSNIPTARFFEEGEISFAFKEEQSFRRVNMLAQPYDWLEVSIFYADIPGLRYKAAEEVGIIRPKQDKGFNFKIKLQDESKNMPAIALGLSDFAGSGIFAGEYLVLSKKIGQLDINGGIGWGIYSSGIQIDNPFISLNNSFENRNFQEANTIGKPDPKDWFSGEDSALFFGVNYLKGNHQVFFENDPIKFSKARFGVRNDASANIGYKYYGFDLFIPSLIIDDNANLNFGIEFKNNFAEEQKKHIKLTKKTNKKIPDLLIGLKNNQIALKELSVGSKGELILSVRQNSYLNIDDANRNIMQTLNEANINNFDEVIIKNYSQGYSVHEERYSKSMPSNKTDHQISRNIYEEKTQFPYISSTFMPEIKTLLASREGFLFNGIYLSALADIYFSENFFINTKFTKSVSNNFDEVFLPPVDTYPAQVRSDIKDYLKNVGDSISIENFEINKIFKMENNYLSLRAGLFESMFGGYGFEYLYLDRFTDFALGFEVFSVKKRDYTYDFNFLDYQVITGHANFYKYFDYLDLTAHFSWGKYLAGDEGFTLDLSKRFDNGLKFGAYFSLTDVSFDEYGEGSFNKGIYVSVPISGLFNNKPFSTFSWTPLTKDPAQKLNLNYKLFGVLERYIY